MKKGELAKMKIIDATIDLFASYGYYQTSYQMIADKTGLKQSNVIYHFKDKHTLFMGVLNKILMSNYQAVEAAMRPEMNAKERLLTHMQMNLEWAINSKKEAQIILLLYYFATFEKSFEAIYQNILTNGRQRVYELVLAGVREGIFDDKQVSERSEILHDMLLASVIPFVSRLKKADSKLKKHTIKKWEEYINLISN